MSSTKKIIKNTFIVINFCILSTIVVIRAINCSVTYDEAYTVLNYVEKIQLNVISIKELILNSVANNHILNTALIYLFQQITNTKFNDLVIRLPNVIMGIFFYGFISYLFYKKKINMITYVLSLFNFYQCQFFSLARGYGLGLVFNTLSLFYFQEYIKSNYVSKKNIFLCLLFCTLAEYSNSISILLMATYFVYFVILSIKERPLYNYNKLLLFIIIVFNILILCYHFFVTRSGKPLYNSVNNSTGFFFYLSNYGINIILSAIVSMIAFILCIKNYKNEKSLFTRILIILISIVFMSLIVFGKGMPATRELIPFYSILSFAIGELFDLYNMTNNQYIILFVTIFVIFSFIRNIQFNVVNEADWNEMKDLRYRAYNSIDNNSVNRNELYDEPVEYPIFYYREQILINKNYDIFVGEYIH